MARLLAKSINVVAEWWSIENLALDPISELINEWKSLDYIEIDAASHTWVDNIREEVIDKAKYKPVQLKKKIYVIDEVHMLTNNAFNALLKIMEEPPEYVVFILATTEIHKVPETILSRCQVFNFTLHTLDDLSARLLHIAKIENIKTEPEALMMIAKLANGAVRDAVKYLEQVSVLWDVTADNVQKFLWVVSQTVVTDMIDLIQQNNFEGMSKNLDTLYAWGTDMSSLTKDILAYTDSHFLDDPSLYTWIADLFIGIYKKLRGAVSPVLIYKSEIWKYMNPSATVIISKQTQVSKKAVPQTQSEKKVEPTSAPIPENEETNTLPNPSKKASNEEKDNSTGTTVDTDLNTFKDTLISKITKMMIKTVVSKYTTISSIENNSVHMICVHEQFYQNLVKTESINYLAWLCTEILWSPHKITTQLMTKEELLMKQMS